MNEGIENQIEDEKKQNESTLSWFGVFFLLVGVTAFFKPVFYFRGGMVDFTGYNHLVGFVLFVTGLFCMIAGSRKKKMP